MCYYYNLTIRRSRKPSVWLWISYFALDTDLLSNSQRAKCSACYYEWGVYQDEWEADTPSNMWFEGAVAESLWRVHLPPIRVEEIKSWSVLVQAAARCRREKTISWRQTPGPYPYAMPISSFRIHRPRIHRPNIVNEHVNTNTLGLTNLNR